MAKRKNDDLFIEEIWKDVKGYNGDYKISNLGRIKSYKKDKENGILMKLYQSKRGYYVVNLCKEGKVKTKNIHSLVANAFIPNLENKPQVNHIDGNKLNNRIDNLEWVTDHENKVHAWETGLQSKEVRNKKTYQYDLFGNLISIYESTLEASEKTVIFEPNISACCLKKLKTIKGFVFSYIPLTIEEVVSRATKYTLKKYNYI